MKEVKKELTVGQMLGCTKFPLEIWYNDKRNRYVEFTNCYWEKWERDTNGKHISYEDSNGYWSKREYDSNGKVIYFESSKGDWSKREYDSNGKVIYYENSNGNILDNRPKVELSLKEIADKFGINVNQLRVKE